jgi:uncharacterized membrane protein YeaQ/YmgE (transglycosylase-associated protein family)
MFGNVEKRTAIRACFGEVHGSVGISYQLFSGGAVFRINGYADARLDDRLQLVNKSGEGMLLDILLGIVGAVVGGWLFHAFGMPGITGLNLYSVVVAVIGAAAFLIVYHALTNRRA